MASSGATAAFEYYRQENESDEPLPEVKRSELEELTYRFAESVWDYFYHEEGMVERPTVSGSSCLIDDMCEIKNSPLKSKEKARLLDELRETSKNILAALERNWAKVSERYMRLKLYCDS